MNCTFIKFKNSHIFHIVFKKHKKSVANSNQIRGYTQVLRLKKPNPPYGKKPGFKPDPGKLGSFTNGFNVVDCVVEVVCA